MLRTRIDEDVMSNRNVRFNGVLEIFIWLAGVGVLVENVLLLHQNQTLHQALDPQITAGAHLEMLAGLALDGRNQILALPSANSKLLIVTFLRAARHARPIKRDGRSWQTPWNKKESAYCG
jgi:hypothetical protein